MLDSEEAEMTELIQNYGILIFIGLFFGLMLWGYSRGRGMGYCGGDRQHEPETVKNDDEISHKSGSCY